ncbi:MAG: F0F1 ATP synthase subunit epsilon [Bosea sp. (in: a-proteobacteria)]
MASFTFELVSPEKALFSGEVASVIVPSADGEMTVFAGHAPVMAVLRPGIVAIDDGKGTITRLFVRGGFADVGAAAVTILADQAIPLDHLTGVVLEKEIEAAEAILHSTPGSDLSHQSAAEAVHMLRDMRRNAMH